MKKLALFCLAGILLLALAGCGNSDTAIDVQKLADDLKSGVAFKDDLAAMPDSVFETYYEVEDGDIVQKAVYAGGGGTAEEIAVFEAKDEDAAARLKEAAEQRIADQKENFENYVPGELTKLNNPVLEVKGEYVILCVCDNPEEARAIIDKAG